MSILTIHIPLKSKKLWIETSITFWIFKYQTIYLSIQVLCCLCWLQAQLANFFHLLLLFFLICFTDVVFCIWVPTISDFFLIKCIREDFFFSAVNNWGIHSYLSFNLTVSTYVIIYHCSFSVTLIGATMRLYCHQTLHCMAIQWGSRSINFPILAVG